MTTIPPIQNREVLAWRTARISGGGGCVEVAPIDGMIAIRHSKKPNDEVIIYTAHEWASFMDGAKKGEFDDLV